MDLTLDRKIEYNGTVYRIIEILESDHLLVIEEEHYQSGNYPMQTYIIPGV